MEISGITSITTANVIDTKRNQKEHTSFETILQNSIPTNNINTEDTPIRPLVQSAFVNEAQLTSDIAIAKSPIDAIEIILQAMEEYMTDLADIQNPKSLPQLHASLEHVEQELTNFHTRYSIQENDPLFTLLNSLEILVLRERYRFNKGSYVI